MKAWVLYPWEDWFVEQEVADRDHLVAARPPESQSALGLSPGVPIAALRVVETVLLDRSWIIPPDGPPDVPVYYERNEREKARVDDAIARLNVAVCFGVSAQRFVWVRA